MCPEPDAVDGISAGKKASGSRIRIARKARGMTQSQLASALCLSQQSIQQYEKKANERDMRADLLIRIAAVLDVSVTYLLSLDDDFSEGETRVISSEGLTARERLLVAGFRMLNGVGKRNLLNTLDDMTKSGKYA